MLCATIIQVRTFTLLSILIHQAVVARCQESLLTPPSYGLAHAEYDRLSHFPSLCQSTSKHLRVRMRDACHFNADTLRLRSTSATARDEASGNIHRMLEWIAMHSPTSVELCK